MIFFYYRYRIDVININCRTVLCIWCNSSPILWFCDI